MNDAYERIQDVSAEMRRLEMEIEAKRASTLPQAVTESPNARDAAPGRSRRHPLLFAFSSALLVMLLVVAVAALASRFLFMGAMLMGGFLASLALPAAIIMMLIIVLLSR